MNSSQSRVIVALDFAEAKSALAFAEKLSPDHCRLKIGKELFTAAGPQLVRALVERNFDLFLDLKFHDIPNTVAKAIAAAADMGVWMTNVHASGGHRMMSASKEMLEQIGSPMLLIAVTVLTSMDNQDLKEVGIDRDTHNQVLELAKIAHGSGLDGVVCSALEAQSLKQSRGADFKLVVTRAYCELAEEALRFLFDELVCTTRDIAVAAVGSIVVVAVEEEEEMLSSSSDEVA